ncbi:wiskott-Aldrich syndrome protein-like [Patiria miniata]|uniref:WH1 domain-containing protein n=1 Tax=Patiria miniata TaxID=46514 RepID=A0A914AQW6_PATMI|nr:wiskott-Aldrich syndrome protein-like [Patiria miniata]
MPQQGCSHLACMTLQSKSPVGSQFSTTTNSYLMAKLHRQEVHVLTPYIPDTLATAVVQVFLAQPPNSWSKKCCGVACFVKDNSVRSYFIRVYDIVNGMKLWEQELYHRFKYIVADDQPFFHTFKTDTCWAALDFADDAEAGDFGTAIEAMLRAKIPRKQGKEVNIQPSPTINTTTATTTTTNTATSKKEDKKEKGKTKT